MDKLYKRTALGYAQPHFMHEWVRKTLMPHFFIKLSLVITTIAPVWITLAFLYWNNGQSLYAALISAASAIFCLIAYAIVKSSPKKFTKTKADALSIKPADKEISGYFVAYMLPILGGGKYFLEPSVAIFFSIVFFIFIWFSKSFYANPVLAIFRYKFYEITTTNGNTYLLLTKREIKDPANINKVVSITSHTRLEVA
jgi:hypothetical protein